MTMTGRLASIGTMAALVGLFSLACGAEQAETRLGPVDGFDLPPADLERVSVGDKAPDFSLRALSGQVHTLSDYQGAKNVILVFYRGHW